jgi:excisionase family DNA binding protein
MTPNQAAKHLGCSTSHLRLLIRNGKIKADKYQMPGGFFYDIKRTEISRFGRLAIPQKGGWQRGRKRKDTTDD